MTIMELAAQYVSCGLSVVPIRADQSKAPTTDWKSWQSVKPTAAELEHYFVGGVGIAVICGAISGNLEVIDFDDAEHFRLWSDLVEQAMGHEFYAKLLIVSTPRPGFHVYMRAETISGNQKLALAPDLAGGIKSLIETRGEGGYVLAPGCPIACHPNLGTYGVVQGRFGEIPIIDTQERESLHAMARSFTQIRTETGFKTPTPAVRHEADRPGSAWSLQTSWEEILQSLGYKFDSTRGEETLWTRPGKERGPSVSTNYAGSDRLHVFSSSCYPFELNANYSKFAAYTLVHHGGDFKRAAKALADQGYGKPPKEVFEPKAAVKPASDILDKVLDLYECGLPSGEYPGWRNLGELWTVRKSEWTLVTGIPSHGKTSFVDAVMVNLARRGWTWAVWSAENLPQELHIANLLEQYLGKPFRDGPTERMSRGELQAGMEWLELHFRFLAMPEEHNETVENLLKAVDATDADGFALDPWNEMTHEFKGITETEYIGRELKRIGRFCRNTQRHGLIVAHPAKMRKEPAKDGTMYYPVPTPYDVSGSAHFRNKADNCLCVWRDETKPGESVVYVQKIRRRFVGKVGRADFHYDIVTGRYSE